MVTEQIRVPGIRWLVPLTPRGLLSIKDESLGVG